MLKEIAAILSGITLAMSAISSPLTGKTLTFTFDFEDIHFFPQPEYFTVGPGLETPDYWGLSVDVSDNAITFTSLHDQLEFINGVTIRIRDVNHEIDPFTSVIVNDSASTWPFSNSRITFNEDNIYLDIGEAPAKQGDVLILDFVSSVPEPTTTVLLLSGVLAAGLWAATRARRTPPAMPHKGLAG